VIQPNAETVFAVQAMFDKHIDALSDEVTAYILEKTGKTPAEFGLMDPGSDDFDATAAVVLDAHGTVGLLLESEGRSLVKDSSDILLYFNARDRKAAVATAKADKRN